MLRVNDLVFKSWMAGEICRQAGYVAGLLAPREAWSLADLDAVMFHLEGLLKEDPHPVSQSVLTYELAARIATVFKVPVPVTPECDIKAAVLAERERCAGILDAKAAGFKKYGYVDSAKSFEDIAKRIRSGE